MAEIDTRPLESVQAAVSIFGGGDQSRHISAVCADRNEEEIATLTKELATCKLQLEVRESQHKQATLKIQALEKAVQELSEQYEKDCMDAHLRIAQLEAENIAVMSRQAEADGERGALRDELAAARGELADARASVAFVLREVEAMETAAILERESTRDALARILKLNESVLSSAVAAIRAEEERSVFFQEMTLEFFNTDRNVEVIRRQVEVMQRMELELLAKTVEAEYLRSELKLVKEVCVPTAEASDATVVTVADAGCKNLDEHDQVQGCGIGVRDQERGAGFTFQRSPEEECFVSGIFRNDGHVTMSDCNKTEIEPSEDVVGDKQGASGAMVPGTTVAEGNPDAQEIRCQHVAKISGEDHHGIQPDDKNTKADSNQEPAESDGVLPKTTACQGNDLLLHSAIAEPGNVAIVGSQEPRAEAAAAPASTPREGDPKIVSKDEDEYYTKELEPEPGQEGSKMDGYVLVSKRGDADADAAAKDKQLDAARAEISDLRFILEETVRRAELAEEAKAALERELREELRRKQRHTTSRRRAGAAGSDSEDGGGHPAPREGAQAPVATPSNRAPRSARPGGEDLPTPRCLTLGKVLNMKYK